MDYEHVWVLIALLGVAVIIWARHLRERKRLAVREMIHLERMAAIEKGATLSELPADLASGADPAEEARTGGQWVQRAALAGAFILILGGVGLSLGFLLLPQTPELGDLHQMAPLGAIPVLVGFGLLLYAWVDRRVFGGERS